MPDIEYIQRERDFCIDKMLGELNCLKSSIDDYKKLIHKEIENRQAVHRTDSCTWLKCHYERFLDARMEFLQRKAYLLGYEDTKIERTENNA